MFSYTLTFPSFVTRVGGGALFRNKLGCDTADKETLGGTAPLLSDASSRGRPYVLSVPWGSVSTAPPVGPERRE